MLALPVGRIAIGFLVLTGLALPAAAATETVLYSFTNLDGAYPEGNVYLHSGSLYGTGEGDPLDKGDYGQVFKLTKSGDSWKEKSVLVFNGADGAWPEAGLIRDSSGDLYGTTSTGDAYDGGNVFELYRSGGKWVEHTVWAFGGTADDGTLPLCDLVMDKSGNIFGTTFEGGTDNVGTVFELSNTGGVWSETVLHSFGADGDGWEPYAGLLTDGSGTFYGTTIYGAEGRGGEGTIFELFRFRGAWKEKVLYTFTGGADGGEPMGTLIMDENGNLYGTTYAGGVSNFYSDVGTVFELARSGDRWKEKVLHDFGGEGDGWNPRAGLTWGPSGQLYGTTSTGSGIVFELTQSGGAWNEIILHKFGVHPDDSSTGAESGDGSSPYGGVILDQDGDLYGTTTEGGSDNLGTVWEITP